MVFHLFKKKNYQVAFPDIVRIRIRFGEPGHAGLQDTIGIINKIYQSLLLAKQRLQISGRDKKGLERILDEIYEMRDFQWLHE